MSDDVSYFRIAAIRCSGGVHSPEGSALREAADEIDRLRAELAEYERWQREMVADYRLLADDHRVSRQGAINGLIYELRAERDALRKDAERYRWLRSGNRVARWDVKYWTGEFWDLMYGVAMDRQIDSALAKE